MNRIILNSCLFFPQRRGKEVANLFSSCEILLMNFQGINCHIERMFLNIYMHISHMHTQQLMHVCIKTSSFVKTISAGIFFFQATQQLLILLTWTVSLCMLIVEMRVEVLGKIYRLFFPSHHSLLSCSSLKLLFTPGFSIWHTFSCWSFWSSLSTALWFQGQAIISRPSVDNFNRAVVTQVNYLKSCTSLLSLRQKPRKTVMILGFNLLICADWN